MRLHARARTDKRAVSRTRSRAHAFARPPAHPPVRPPARASAHAPVCPPAPAPSPARPHRRPLARAVWPPARPRPLAMCTVRRDRRHPNVSSMGSVPSEKNVHSAWHRRRTPSPHPCNVASRHMCQWTGSGERKKRALSVSSSCSRPGQHCMGRARGCLSRSSSEFRSARFFRSGREGGRGYSAPTVSEASFLMT